MPYLDDVFRFSLGLTRNRAQAEDLVQDTYMKAFKAFPTFRSGSNAKSWLFRICKNHFIDRYRVVSPGPSINHWLRMLPLRMFPSFRSGF